MGYIKQEKYTKQELKWILGLIDKAVYEAAEQIKECESAPGLKELVKLKHDNMQDLRDKTQKMINRLIARENQR